MELSTDPDSKSNVNEKMEMRSRSAEVEQVILEFHFDDDEGSQTGFTKVVQIPSEVIQTSEGAT